MEGIIIIVIISIKKEYFISFHSYFLFVLHDKTGLIFLTRWFNKNIQISYYEYTKPTYGQLLYQVFEIT